MEVGTSIGAVLVPIEVHYGFGRHKVFLTPHQLQEFQKYTFGEWIQTFATLMWTKVSICLFLLRIPVQKHFIRPLQAALVFLILSNVVLTILWVVQCRPVAAAWNDSIDGKCFSKLQKECIILAQASKLRLFPCFPAKAFMWPLADVRGLTQSYRLFPISHLLHARFCSCGMFT